MISIFNSVVYFVRDIEESAKWYSELFDCEVKYENNDYAYICVASGKLGFHTEDKKNKNSKSGQTVYWSVANLADAIEIFTSKGAMIYREPMETDLGEFACMLIDPFGNSIGLISDKA